MSRNLSPSGNQLEASYPFRYDKVYISYEVASVKCAATFNDELCLDELDWECWDGEDLLIECQNPNDVYVIPGTGTQVPTTTSTTTTTTSTTTTTAAPISCCDVMQVKYNSVELELQAIDSLIWTQNDYSMELVYSDYLAIYVGDEIQCYIGPSKLIDLFYEMKDVDHFYRTMILYVNSDFDSNTCPVDISGPWRCQTDGIYTNADIQVRKFKLNTKLD